MSFFWLLHRLCVALFWAFWLLAAFYVYERRAALQPAFDYAELVWNRDPNAPRQWPQLAGRVVSAYSGDGFTLRDDAGYAFNYGLAGVEAPRVEPDSPPQLRVQSAESSTNLHQLLVGQRVRIDVTKGNPQTRTGLGLVWVGSTNMNAVVLASGWARLNREQIRGLPLRDQFAMATAERRARRQGLGVWSTNPPGAAAPPPSQRPVPLEHAAPDPTPSR